MYAIRSYYALEARDIVALLNFLVDPRDDLALAHVLRSPIFLLTDEDLLALAGHQGMSWWENLSLWAEQADAPDAVRRASRLLTDWRALAGKVPVHDLLV